MSDFRRPGRESVPRAQATSGAETQWWRARLSLRSSGPTEVLGEVGVPFTCKDAPKPAALGHAVGLSALARAVEQAVQLEQCDAGFGALQADPGDVVHLGRLCRRRFVERSLVGKIDSGPALGRGLCRAARGAPGGRSDGFARLGRVERPERSKRCRLRHR